MKKRFTRHGQQMIISVELNVSPKKEKGLYQEHLVTVSNLFSNRFYSTHRINSSKQNLEDEIVRIEDEAKKEIDSYVKGLKTDAETTLESLGYS
tara:strand:- start:107 stop:388 length:282 start_codon:yes stop_codon:yes gene_type:complete